MFDKMRWLNAQLGEGRLFPLRDKDRAWDPHIFVLGSGEAAVVAGYFLFESAVSMEAFWAELCSTATVTVDGWFSWTEPCHPVGENLCTLVLAFDALEPLHGPMGRDRALLAVQHYLAWCPFKKRWNEPCWRHSVAAFMELVPIDAHER